MSLAASKGQIVIDPENNYEWVVYDVSQQSIWIKRLDKPANTAWITHGDFEEYGWQIKKTPDGWTVHSDVSAKQVGGTHYIDLAIQPFEVIRRNKMGFFDGNALKYLMRYKAKNGIEDLKKAIHYIEELIRDLEDASDAR